MISPQNIPIEVQENFQTIEYLNGNLKQEPNIFFYVIDLCVSEDELQAIKEAIQQSLNIIQEETWVGLITFGKNCYVHELGFQDYIRNYAIKGDKVYTPDQIRSFMGIVNNNDPRKKASEGVLNKFILSLKECDFNFNTILDEIQIDNWQPKVGERKKQCFGQAINVAISLLECCNFKGSRILSFLGSPCTYGEGQVVDIALEQNIRSYNDIIQENKLTKHVQNATNFYKKQVQRAVNQQMVIDIYGFCPDQFGLLEKGLLAQETGGYIVVNENFNSNIFKETYKKIFIRDNQQNLNMVTSAQIKLMVNSAVKIQGALGNCITLNNKSPQASGTIVGQGNTNEWYLGSIDRSSTISFQFEMNTKQNQNIQNVFFQFKTTYKNTFGQIVTRITTQKRKIALNQNFIEIQQGFDQEAAVVLLTKQIILKVKENQTTSEILKYIDRNLIRLMQKFAVIDIGNRQLNIPPQMDIYPQLIYNLRKSVFVNTFGMSPDELTFYQSTFNRENVSNCIIMIQPALLEYTLNDQNPQPILLDNKALKNNVVLLLDGYFQVLTWYGATVQKLIQNNEINEPQNFHYKELIENPQIDIDYIMNDRFPVPQYFQTYPGHTKERYLLARLNPNEDFKEEQHWLTDEASLNKFMDHLTKLVIQQNAQ